MDLDLLPVNGDRVVCGMRKHLPRKERAHEWVSLGIDTRHGGEFGEFTDMEVFACLECGRDKQKKIPVPRVTVDEDALDALIEMAEESLRGRGVPPHSLDEDFFHLDELVRALNIKKVN